MKCTVMLPPGTALYKHQHNENNPKQKREIHITFLVSYNNNNNVNKRGIIYNKAISMPQ